jgi:hypothetical protein
MTPRQKLEALIDLFEVNLREAFLAAIQDVVDNAILEEVIRAIQAGDAERAFRVLGFNDAAMRPLTAALEQAFEQGGVMTGETFPRYLTTPSGRSVFRFDVRNSRAEAWLRNRSSELVTRITEDARVNVRNTLEIGMRDGRNPRNVGLDIIGRYDPVTKHRVGGVIGLTQNQELWVRNTRQKLVTLDDGYFKLQLRDKRFDSVVARAIRDKQPLDQKTVDKLIVRYKDNALKHRGEAIARTEAIQALNASEYEALNQAVDMGATKAEAVQREWDDTGDGRTRPTHRALNGQRVGLKEPFVSPSGARMMFPGDTSLDAPAEEVVMCRCRQRTIIDWFHGVT